MRATRAYRHNLNSINVACFFIFGRCCGDVGRFDSDNVGWFHFEKLCRRGVCVVTLVMLVGAEGERLEKESEMEKVAGCSVYRIFI